MFQGRPLYHTKVLKFPKPIPAYAYTYDPPRDSTLTYQPIGKPRLSIERDSVKKIKKFFYFF